MVSYTPMRYNPKPDEPPPDLNDLKVREYDWGKLYTKIITCEELGFIAIDNEEIIISKDIAPIPLKNEKNIEKTVDILAKKIKALLK
ncbi:MAG: hypothetical protein ABIC95_05495 [archaeon]